MYPDDPKINPPQPPAPGSPLPGEAQGAPTGPGPSGEPADPQERIDGLRAWLATLDHTVKVRTWILALVMALTLAVAVAALIIAIQVRDNQVTQGQVDALSTRIDAVEAEMLNLQGAASDIMEGDFASLTEDIEKLQRRVGRLSDANEATEGQVEDLNRQISRLRDDMNDLESQISELQGEIDALENENLNRTP